jgi:tetratricopeptide (TPR) repeat protein
MSTPEAAAAANEVHRALTAGDLARATALAQSLLARHGNWPPAVHLAGMVARANGDLARAEQLMRQSLAMPGVMGKTRAEYANNLGNLLRMAGFIPAAEAAYRHALQAHDLPQARVGLGRVLLELDRAREAVPVLRGFAGSQSSIAGVLLLAEALAQSGERKPALNLLAGLDPITRSQPNVQLALAQRLGAVGRTQEAQALLQPLLAGDQEVNARLALAELSMNQRDWPMARAVLEAGLARHPDDTELLGRGAALAWMMGDPINFADGLRAAVARRPDDANLRLTLCNALENAGQQAAAESALREGMARNPGNAVFLALLAHQHAQRTELTQARPLIEQALAIAPELPMIREHAAIVAMIGQRVEDALQHTRWLVERSPTGQVPRALRVLALRMAGDAEWERIAAPDRVCHVSTPTPPVGFVSAAEFQLQLAERIRRLHTLHAHPLQNSVRYGTQVEIDSDTESDPVIRGFFKMIHGEVDNFIRAMPKDPSHPLFAHKGTGFRLSGCWTVRLRGGSGRHVSHIHPRGWISSAYYLTVPAEVANDTDRAGWLSFGKPPYPIPGLDATGWVQPAPGRLALFPSYQWHAVEPFPGLGERMTIAFDVIPTGG